MASEVQDESRARWAELSWTAQGELLLKTSASLTVFKYYRHSIQGAQEQHLSCLWRWPVPLPREGTASLATPAPEPEPEPGVLGAVAISPDGSAIAAVSLLDPRRVRIWWRTMTSSDEAGAIALTATGLVQGSMRRLREEALSSTLEESSSLGAGAGPSVGDHEYGGFGSDADFFDHEEAEVVEKEEEGKDLKDLPVPKSPNRQQSVDMLDIFHPDFKPARVWDSESVISSTTNGDQDYGSIWMEGQSLTLASPVESLSWRPSPRGMRNVLLTVQASDPTFGLLSPGREANIWVMVSLAAGDGGAGAGGVDLAPDLFDPSGGEVGVESLGLAHWAKVPDWTLLATPPD